MNIRKFKFLLISSILVIIAACESGPSERPNEWIGEWKTTWKTLPDSEETLLVFTDYETDGNISFTENDVTVTINGFPGCIFGPDTLSHTQQWKVTNNAQLQFFTLPDTIGITYSIMSVSDEKIELRLLEDIFLTLEKRSNNP